MADNLLHSSADVTEYGSLNLTEPLGLIYFDFSFSSRKYIGRNAKMQNT
jgi:hypothetical protein